MQGSWDITLWSPTSVNQIPSWEDFVTNCVAVREISSLIFKAPYTPQYWVERARALRILGLPELAAGDARKANRLCNVKLSRDTSSLGGKVQVQIQHYIDHQKGRHTAVAKTLGLQDEIDETYKDADQVLLESLGLMSDYWECLEICKEGKARFPSELLYENGFTQAKTSYEGKLQKLRSANMPVADINRQLLYGGVLHKPYPFIAPGFLRRSEGLQAEIADQLKLCSNGKCTLGRSNMIGLGNADVLGIIATSDIGKDTDIFQEHTPLAATSVSPMQSDLGDKTQREYCFNQGRWQTKCHECSTIYCGIFCQWQAPCEYHQALCGKDFSWLYSPVKGKQRDREQIVEEAFWLRVLAICVQARCHPLDHTLIARLTPQYGHAKMANKWSLSGHVDRTHRILEQLGIDIFADRRYDTWVLQTIWSRIANNHFQSRFKSAEHLFRNVGKFSCFFNHSCEPNVYNGPMDNDTGNEICPAATVAMAIKPIKKGEELFISYVNMAGWGKAARQLKLLPWLAGACQCSNCKREI